MAKAKGQAAAKKHVGGFKLEEGNGGWGVFCKKCKTPVGGSPNKEVAQEIMKRLKGKKHAC